MRSRQFKRLGPSLMNQLLAENILPETGLSMKKKGSLFKKGLSKSRVVKRKNILDKDSFRVNCQLKVKQLDVESQI